MLGRCLVRLGMLCVAGQSAVLIADDGWQQNLETGKTLQRQGHYAEAKQHFLAAFAAAEHFASNDGRKFLIRIQLGLATASLGQYSEAENWDREAIREGADIKGAYDWELSIPLTNLAMVYRDEGKYAKAEEAAQRAWDAVSENSQAPPSTRAVALGTLGSIAYLRGNLPQAEELLHGSIAIEEKLQPPDANILAQDLNNLVGVYWKEGEREEALSTLQNAYALYQKAFGPGHPNLFYILSATAAIEADSGQYDEAVKTIKEAIRLTQAADGGNPALLRDALASEVTWLRKLGRKDEAKRALAEAKTIGAAAAQQTFAQYTVDVSDLKKTRPAD